jgi:hypothetical protein
VTGRAVVVLRRRPRDTVGARPGGRDGHGACWPRHREGVRRAHPRDRRRRPVDRHCGRVGAGGGERRVADGDVLTGDRDRAQVRRCLRRRQDQHRAACGKHRCHRQQRPHRSSRPAASSVRRSHSPVPSRSFSTHDSSCGSCVGVRRPGAPRLVARRMPSAQSAVNPCRTTIAAAAREERDACADQCALRPPSCTQYEVDACRNAGPRNAYPGKLGYRETFAARMITP